MRHRSRVPTKTVGCVLVRLVVVLVCAFFLCRTCTVTLATAFPTSSLVATNGIYLRFRFDLHCKHKNHHQCGILCTPEAALLTDESKQSIVSCLVNAGIWIDDGNSSSESNDKGKDTIQDSSRSSEVLLLLARDFVDRPEVFSSLLITDFGFPVLVAHQTRALVMAMIRDEQEDGYPNNDDNDINAAIGNTKTKINNRNSNSNSSTEDNKEAASIVSNTKKPVELPSDDDSTGGASANTNKNTKTKTFSNEELKSTIVNERAKRRKQSTVDYNYGLPKNYATIYPRLGLELDDYYTFMTQISTFSQESPIRDATAKVYMNHAKLFLGWCCQNSKTNDGNGHEGQGAESAVAKEDMSIFAILPSKEKESADNIIRFVLWLRTRDISVSYEANLLRGIIKLLKFRFSKESNSDPLDGKNSFDDIPIIKEVRKLHRDANQRQRLAPRSSDESKKWITWQDYLGVAQNTKNEVLELIRSYEALPPSERKYAKGDTDRLYSLGQVRVAEAYQRYLILAILASIPDRQRTIRELEVGRTLIKDTDCGCWVVKHGPGDYKTGKHYGERPAMQLAEELTPAIDDFIERWRPSLNPATNVLLVQAKTGKPMTSNSIFKRVVRCCFKYTGKSVNPHLLRDIIVTHVRETEASEKELEALALYMGHSIQMQRSSYDRRTLSSKVAPAVKLMESMNKIDGG